MSVPAQPAVAADRFAREIARFLVGSTQRSRQLNGIPLGGPCAEGWLILEPWFLVLAHSDAVPLRTNESCEGRAKPVMLGVVPISVIPSSAVARVGLEIGDSCLGSAMYRRTRPTRRCSRPLRA